MDEKPKTPLDKDALAVAKRIVAFEKPSRVILFGSRGRGTAREDSDIDLTRYFLSEASQAVDEFLFSKFKKNQRGDYNE